MFLLRALSGFMCSEQCHSRKQKKNPHKTKGTLTKIEGIDDGDFLPEILQLVFQNLNIRDLNRAAAVNKLWNKVAMREQKQRGFETTVIDVKSDNLYDSVKAKPYVALMFVTTNGHDEFNKLALKILKKYKNHFPNYLVVVRVDFDVTMDERTISCNNAMTDGGILSLFIPQYRDLKIRAAYRPHFDDDFLNEFLPEDLHLNVTFIVFVKNSFPDGLSPLFALLKKYMAERQQKFSLWGAGFDYSSYAAVNSKIHKRIRKIFTRPMLAIDYNGIFAMSITGSSLESSSIVFGYSTKKDQISKILIDFRDKLQFKRHTFGLACGSIEMFRDSSSRLPDVCTFSEMLQAVKIIFPNVPIIGACGTEVFNHYCGLNSQVDDPTQELCHDMNTFSLMILTSD